MYCNSCGKYNSKGSKFCQSCGIKLVQEASEVEHATTSDVNNKTEHERNEGSKQNNEKINAGLGGWLVWVGLGLLIAPFLYGYQVIGYFPLFNRTYDIPGYLSLLQFEFIVELVLFFVSIYLIYLYFKKNKKFPKYYIIFLIATAVYVVLDHLFLSSLVAPTQEQQKMISDTLSQNSSNLSRSIFGAIIWVSYMLKSKRVKATFINK